MAPLFPSWLGNGNSVFVLFTGMGTLGSGLARLDFSAYGFAETGLEDEYDIEAFCVAKCGTIAVRGFAVQVLAGMDIETDRSYNAALTTSNAP
jgi:hypothetical protein